MKYVIALEDTVHWDRGEQLLYLGEIENMKGHGVYMENNGKIHHGLHTDSFFEYEGFYIGLFNLPDFLKEDTDDNGNKFYALPTNLTNILCELDDSHAPNAAERSFIIQATKIVYGE